MLKNLTDTKIIILYGVLFESIGLFLGAISAIFILSSGISVLELGDIKSFQTLILVCLGLYAGKLADSIDRKLITLASLFFEILWMAISYLGGEFHSFYIFMLAEFFTALSIVLNKNSYNTYLIDAYIKEYKNKNFGKALFVYNQYTFLAVAISSFIGTICYQYINIYSALVCAFALSVLFLFFIFLLPSQKVNKTKRKSRHKVLKIMR